MRKPAKVSCTDPKEMRAHSRNWGLTKHIASGLLPASLMAKVDAAAAQLRWFQGAAEDEGRSRDIRRREAEDRLQEVIDDCRVRLARLDDEFARGRREGMW